MDKLDTNKLYKMQKELDAYILQGRDRTLEQIILALDVEISELANETRCFKYWSNKGPGPKERILDELADVLHFILSLANYFELKSFQETEFISEEDDLVNIFINLNIAVYKMLGFKNLSKLSFVERDKTLVISAMIESVIKINRKLGYTEKELEEAYIKKNKENYKRQQEGY